MLVRCWTFGLFSLICYYEQMPTNLCIDRCSHFFLSKYLGWILGLHNKHMFSCIKNNCQTIFQYGYSILHFHQLWNSFPCSAFQPIHIASVLNFRHGSGCAGGSPCGLNLHVLVTKMSTIFPLFLWKKCLLWSACANSVAYLLLYLGFKYSRYKWLLRCF